MTIMIIAVDTVLKERFKSFFSPLGYSIIQYTHPLKAMDNMNEIDPDILICSTSDYPRHWKLIIKQLRESRSRDEVVAVLTIPENFSSEEANKAAFLGVNMLYPESLETMEDFQELDNRISRYKTPPEHTQQYSWIPTEKNRVSFIFLHPEEYRMISGRFIKLNPAGGIFRPDDHSDIQKLKPGTSIQNASLKISDTLLDMDARIIRNNGVLSMAFTNFSDGGFDLLMKEVNQHIAAYQAISAVQY